MYNLTNFTASKTVLDLVVAANQFSSQMLMNGLILAVFLVSLMALKRYDFDDALAVSSFISIAVTFFFYLAHLIPIYWVLLFGFMLGAVMLFKFTAGS
jgi:hypothetical protein